VPKCCRKGGGLATKRNIKINKRLYKAKNSKKNPWLKKWSGHGRTGRTADYSPRLETPSSNFLWSDGCMSSIRDGVAGLRQVDADRMIADPQ